MAIVTVIIVLELVAILPDNSRIGYCKIIRGHAYIYYCGKQIIKWNPGGARLSTWKIGPMDLFVRTTVEYLLLSTSLPTRRVRVL